MRWPRTLPLELSWGERAMAARHVRPAICLSLGWAPLLTPDDERREAAVRRNRLAGVRGRGPLGRS